MICHFIKIDLSLAQYLGRVLLLLLCWSCLPAVEAGTLSLLSPNIVRSEEDTGTKEVTITVGREGGTVGEVSVDYRTVDGTALANEDYLPAVGTLVWVDGDAEDKSFILSIVNDRIYEESRESLTIILSNPQGGAVLGQSDGLIRIDDNDPDPDFGSVSLHEGMDFHGPLDPRSSWVGMTKDSHDGYDAAHSPINAPYVTDNLQITIGGPVTLSWWWKVKGSGLLACNVDSIAVVPAQTSENWKREEINIGPGIHTISWDPSSFGQPLSQTVGGIIDEVAFVGNGSVSILPVSLIVEGRSAQHQIVVSRYGGQSGEVSVLFTTEADTADPGLDYTSHSERLIWADGDNADKIIQLPIIDDGTPESIEFFTARLSDSTGGAVIVDGSRTLVIMDDDSGIDVVQSNVVVQEGSDVVATVALRRSGTLWGDISTQVQAVAGTAMPGSDFDASLQTVVWSSNDMADKTIVIPLTDDAVPESQESFTITLTNTTEGVVVMQPSCAVTIIDNDPGLRPIETAMHVTEGQPDAVPLVIQRLGGSVGPVSVSVTASADSAVENDDFETVSTLVSWDDGDAADKTVLIDLIDDAIPEDEERFFIQLSDATEGVEVMQSVVAVVVTDDDPGIAPAASSIFAVEGLSGSADVVLLRLGGSSGAISVTVMTVADSAMADEDYEPVSTVVTWLDGDASPKTVSVNLIDDAVPEVIEQFVIQLSDASEGVEIVQSSVACVVTDDDPGIASAASLITAVEGQPAPAAVELHRLGGSSGAISVTATTMADSAIADDDYAPVATIVTWADGDVSPKTISLDIIDDVVPEAEERFTVLLTDASAGVEIVQPSVVVAVTDDDPGIAPSVSSLSVVEGQPAPAEVVLRRLGGSSGAISVTATTVADSAAADEDYAPVSTVVTWPDGDASPKAVYVGLIDDATPEETERFVLQLSEATEGVEIVQASVEVILTDDDPGIAPTVLSISAVESQSAPAAVVLRRLGGSSGAISVVVKTTADSAMADEDYTPVDTLVTWSDGDTLPKTVTVDLIDDAVPEADERFSVVLSDATVGVEMMHQTVDVMIVDDDHGVAIVGVDASVSETGGPSVPVMIRRLGTSSGTVSVTVSTQPGTASAHADYVPNSEAVLWMDGDVADKQVMIQVLDDEQPEAIEHLGLILVNPGSGVSVEQGTFVLSIIDDDARRLVRIRAAEQETLDLVALLIEQWIEAVLVESWEAIVPESIMHDFQCDMQQDAVFNLIAPGAAAN